MREYYTICFFSAETFPEMLKRMPADAIEMMSEVFPLLMKGRGSPVGGILPLTTRALIAVCTP